MIGALIMHFKKFRLHIILELLIIVTFLSVSIFFIIGRNIRDHLFPYFSTRCLEYNQKDFHRKLNDRIVDYSDEARLRGIEVCKNLSDVKERISVGKLVKVRSGRWYLVERMAYSYPYLTGDSKILLDEIARRFRIKTSQKGLKGAKFIITSMTRNLTELKKLRRNNQNTSENSPHLYGNAFDISYKRFVAHKWLLTNCDQKFLKDALGEVIWQLREEGKCWATYERVQNCYHVVSR
jgi:hypothetical protein